MSDSTAGQKILCVCAGWLLLLLALGCRNHEAARAALDQVLASNRVDRLVVFGEKPDGSLTTNVLTGNEAVALLAQLSATNRVPNAIRRK